MDQEKTFYKEFEVFSKRTPASAFSHQFSLVAPNEELALVMAQENFMRREPVADIWVVERGNIRGLNQDEKASLHRLDNKDYRNTKGYGYLKKKWRKYEQQMLDEKEILSWSGGESK
ncbi:1,2-phenylacetyl-CoA epoxidase subunit PaaB [Shouchella shacheensis]|uniref:1,2-phenylacetyl-CoA epoxidase subunit PaaB n=1 Tax=Shouchella shacheensis TaxID=1649580 RepID=UPI000AF35E2C|nr:1,2-phenylacetyl-CoA epoxidase subunit PaaB [Shouchella shacheensis]